MTMPKDSRKNMLYLDDIQIGLQFISDSHSFDAEQIKAFARQFDPQPFHLDEEAARKSLFGGLIASGWHTAAITMRLLVESVGCRFAGGLIGRGGEISWPNPTYPGDTIHVECEVLDVKASRSRPDWGTVKIQNHTLNHQQQIVQLFIADVMVKRKPLV